MIIFCLYPVAKPVALILDVMLGEELGNILSKKELTKMLELHVLHGSVDEEVGRTLAGALKYQEMTVESVMTPIEDAFMLSAACRRSRYFAARKARLARCEYPREARARARN